MHISEQAKVKAASCWMSHYLTLCVLLCVCVCVCMSIFVELNFSWMPVHTLFIWVCIIHEGCNKQRLPPFIPHPPSLSLMHTHTHTHTHAGLLAHILFTSSLSVIRPVGSSRREIKRWRRRVMVLERWSDAQTGYEWKNKNLCAAITWQPPPPKKKKTQHLLSTCSCAISFIFLYRCPAHRLPTTSISFVLLSFGSSTSRRSHGADGTVRFRGQIIPFSWMRLFFFVWFLGSAYML